MYKKMKFYCICKKNTKPEIVEYLRSSCEKLKVDFHELYIETYDYTNNIKIEKGDMLYRPYIAKRCQTLEKFLLSKELTTFYKDYKRSISKYPTSFFVHQKENVPVPKTIFDLSENRDLLKKYVDYVGGFPVILKVVGGSCGVGVLKIDSLSSLFSVVDYLRSENVDELVIREFIDIGKPSYSNRAVILGDKLEIAYKNTNVSSSDDFRSNVDQTTRKREIIKLPKEDEKILVKAVSTLDIELGAVDFVYDKSGNLKIFEVNFPLNFVPIIEDLKYDINDRMVEYLIKKAKNKYQVHI